MNQPDDPGIHGDDVVEPLVFGGKARHHADSVIRTIRRNAGKMTITELAKAVCWSETHLRKQARKHGIDLRYPPCDRANEPEPRGA